MKKIIPFFILFVGNASLALPGDFVCKVKPQPGVSPAKQIVGTYILKQLKNPGSFAIQYESADGSIKKTLAPKAYLAVKNKESDETDFAYNDGYRKATDALPQYQAVPWDKVGFFGRVYADLGGEDEDEIMIGFILGAAIKPTEAEILDIFGVSNDSPFLCEKLDTNPKRLPAAPPIG